VEYVCGLLFERPTACRAITRTIEGEQTTRRTDDRTMAIGLSVTWTHCSARYKVTSEINRRIRVDVPLRPRGRKRASVRTSSFPLPCPPPSPVPLSLDLPHVCTNELMRLRGPDSLPLCPPTPLACSLRPPTLPRVRADGLHPHRHGADARKKIKKLKNNFILF
jgi:hypothetical protein